MLPGLIDFVSLNSQVSLFLLQDPIIHSELLSPSARHTTGGEISSGRSITGRHGNTSAHDGRRRDVGGIRDWNRWYDSRGSPRIHHECIDDQGMCIEATTLQLILLVRSDEVTCMA